MVSTITVGNEYLQDTRAIKVEDPSEHGDLRFFMISEHVRGNPLAWVNPILPGYHIDFIVGRDTDQKLFCNKQN